MITGLLNIEAKLLHLRPSGSGCGEPVHMADVVTPLIGADIVEFETDAASFAGKIAKPKPIDLAAVVDAGTPSAHRDEVIEIEG